MLNDRLEKIRRFSHQLPALSKPADTPYDERYIYISFSLLLPDLLHFKPEEVGLRTAWRARIIAVAFVKGLAAFVEIPDDGFALVLVVSISREAVYGVVSFSFKGISVRIAYPGLRTSHARMISLMIQSGSCQTYCSRMAWRFGINVILRCLKET